MERLAPIVRLVCGLHEAADISMASFKLCNLRQIATIIVSNGKAPNEKAPNTTVKVNKGPLSFITSPGVPQWAAFEWKRNSDERRLSCNAVGDSGAAQMTM